MTSILIRADADNRIGAGHVLRCLSLAQACLNQGGQVAFACARIEPKLRDHLQAEGVAVHTLDTEPGSAADAEKTVGLIDRLKPTWVIADGYSFGDKYQQAIKRSGAKLLVLDDFRHADHANADVILNPNASVDASLYADREDQTNVLAGHRYALLRHEFQAWRGWKREVPEVASKLVVTLGGGRYDDLLRLIVRGIAQSVTVKTEIRVVSPNLPENLDGIHDEARNRSASFEFLPFVKDMAKLLAWADLAIAGGGSNCWERALLGLPSLVLVLADNQDANAAFCESQGIGLNLGKYQKLTDTALATTLKAILVDREKRATMARAGIKLIDGFGANRVYDHLKANEVSLRMVREEDCRWVFEVANDPVVRAASFRSDPILWDGHQQWFAKKVQSPNCVYYIALSEEGAPIGQAYFDVSGSEAVVSVALASAARGRGYGTLLVRKASQEFFGQMEGVSVVHAYVKPANEASLKAFTKAGYVRSELTTVSGHLAEHLVWRR